MLATPNARLLAISGSVRRSSRSMTSGTAITFSANENTANASRSGTSRPTATTTASTEITTDWAA